VESLDIVSRIVHVSTAITIVGGTLFTYFILLPSARGLSEESHQALAGEINRRWKRFVHIGILLFLVSGFYNYFRAMGLHKGDGLYHGLVGTKMLLAFAMFFIASALVGRSAKLQSMRDNKAFWLKLMVVMAVVIVAISGYVKVRGPKSKATETPAITAANPLPDDVCESADYEAVREDSVAVR
jgi:uncharacterized membrane protein